jgi:hypothetical protein
MELSSIVIKGNEPLIEIKKMIPAEYHKEFKKIRQNGLDAINQTEYTLKGSINKNKIFLNLDELSFVMDDEKKGTTKIFSTLLDKDSDFEELNFEPFKNTAVEKLRITTHTFTKINCFLSFQIKK